MPAFSTIDPILLDGTGSGGGGTSDGRSMRLTISQANHGLVEGDIVRYDSSVGYTAAKADSLVSARALGIVESKTTNAFVLVLGGKYDISASSTLTFAPGSLYYLDDSRLGKLSLTAPTNASSVNLPIFVAVGQTSGFVVNTLKSQRVQEAGLYTPIGSIVPFVAPANKIPSNWLLCNGDTFSKGSSDYSSLYSYIGNNYYVLASITGNGSTGNITFNSSSATIPTNGIQDTRNHRLENGDIFIIAWPPKSLPSDSYTDQIIVTITGATYSNNVCQFTKTSVVAGAGTLPSSTTLIEFKSFDEGLYAYTANKFFIPDLRGRSPFGAHTGHNLSTGRQLGFIAGQENVTLNSSQLPPHSHGIGITGPPAASLQSPTNAATITGIDYAGVLRTNVRTYISTDLNNSAASSHDNMPPFVITNWIIRYTEVAGVAFESGPAGPAGAAGAQGPQGIQGTTGNTGSTGPQGNTGPRGNTGPQGTTGATGPQGPAGTPGSGGAQGPAGVTGATGPDGSLLVGDTPIDSGMSTNNFLLGGSNNYIFIPSGLSASIFQSGSGAQLISFDYGKYYADRPITISDAIISDATNKCFIYADVSQSNHLINISGNFGVTGTSGNYKISVRSKTSTVNGITTTDWILIDENCTNTFLQGAHQVIAATASTADAGYYDIQFINKYSGATGVTSISGSSCSVLGSIKTADVIFGITGTTNDTVFVFSGGNKCVSFGIGGNTGATGPDILLLGSSITNDIGVQCDFTRIRLGPNIWFAELERGLVLNNSVLEA